MSILLLPKRDKTSIGLIGHTIIDYPSPESARECIKVMVEAGVDLIELQIPFSEPIADGPTFMAANHQAIANGVSVAQCFDFMHEVSAQYAIPFVFMSYANILFQQGFAEFVSMAKRVGAKGAIVPDLPVENAADYLAACQQFEFAAIPVIPPNVTQTRLQQITQSADGFIYAVARSGVTGAKTDFNQELEQFVLRSRNNTQLPVAVGFGVSTPEDVELLKPYADYAIVGTQAMRVLQQQGINGLRHFWQQLAACK